MKRFLTIGIIWIIILTMSLSGCSLPASTGIENPPITTATNPPSENSASLSDVPPFSNAPYVIINQNEPSFGSEEFHTTSFESYSDLDGLGRCGAAYACIGRDLMPTAERGKIGQIKPSGWKTVKYDFIDGTYLYNRCHLIGYQLTAENANEKNLITGTRYMNTEGMLPFENMVANYIKETNHHVLYRVTPIFKDQNLVASGVQMEAKSVEDNGEGICFNVYVYNNQPGIAIDYATGESNLIPNPSQEEANDPKESGQPKMQTYVLNTHTKKFHLPSCQSIVQIKEENKSTFNGSRDQLIKEYSPCKACNP